MEYVTGQMTEVLNGLRQANKFCDGEIRTEDGGEFPIHRAVMAACSPYFRALFTNVICETENRVVTIPDVTADVMSAIIDFAYTGESKVTAENVEELLPVADQFHVLTLVQKCSEFLKGQLRVENCIGIYKFARHFFCPHLTMVAKLFIQKKFVAVATESIEWLQLNEDELISLIDSDDINAKMEESVFEAIARWVKSNPETRRLVMHKLLSNVRFGLLPRIYFEDVILANTNTQSKECQDYLGACHNRLKEIEANNGTDADQTDELFRPRVPHDILFAVGGWSAGSPTNFIETYDCRADKWYLTMATDRTPRAYHGTAVVDGKLYVIGGFDGTDYFNSVRCFDPAKQTWTEVAPMYTQRCYVSVAVLNGFIYALGGYDGRVRLASAERYDPKHNQWTIIQAMSRQRSDASCATLNGKVYIVGGFDGHEVTNTVEIFDPEKNQWQLTHSMLSRRSGVGATTFQGFIYSIGGFNGVTRLCSGEKYDPRTGEWSAIPDMFSPRSNFGIGVADNMIFVVGGFNGSTTVPYVECFDGVDWFDAVSMNLNRSALNACVVNNLPNARDYSFHGQGMQAIGQDGESSTNGRSEDGSSHQMGAS